MGGRSDELSSSHYEVLGVDPSADYVEIRAKYRAAVLAFHPDRFPSSCLIAEGAKSWNSADDGRFSLGSSGNVDRRIREIGAEFSATYRSREQSNEAEQFFRVQKAWEVLRDSDSRATYDRFLSAQRLAHQQEESTKVIGEEVYIEDMEIHEDEEAALTSIALPIMLAAYSVTPPLAVSLSKPEYYDCKVCLRQWILQSWEAGNLAGAGVP
ncbi:hypothetical protein AXG93_4461s1620 [Marchantia polymorpha subsp. ruderalis]|uniref:J domain-containing protein n=1 Tax=Marchantia polymorpha subsp. ruderalis TaxID=1480154 RepID=A0A176WRD9_MARPO|nr:hypothetical protein AXG93_4461s1620 [Marchantia polymorpha subsp. ruderalis]